MGVASVKVELEMERVIACSRRVIGLKGGCEKVLGLDSGSKNSSCGSMAELYKEL